MDDPEQILASLGGRASTRAIAVKMPTEPPIRRLREQLEARQAVRKLGGGYFALEEHPSPLLKDWLEHWLGERRLPLEDVVSAIETEWVHGYGPSIRAWVQQDPGAVRSTQGEVWIFRSRRRPT
jgi:hypothetical protein